MYVLGEKLILKIILSHQAYVDLYLESLENLKD